MPLKNNKQGNIAEQTHKLGKYKKKNISILPCFRREKEGMPSFGHDSNQTSKSKMSMQYSLRVKQEMQKKT